jgi:iron-sulfur cluster assembly accessory protein
VPTNLTDQAADPTRRVRPVVFAFLLLALMTLGELRLRDRLLYANRVEFDFVAFNVAAIRDGRPVFKAWQHRVLSPVAVWAIGRLAGRDPQAIKVFCNLMIATANLLLFSIIRRRGGNLVQSLVGVAVFGFGRLLLAYKLEYADEFAPEDHVFEDHGVKVIVDPKSLPYLEGTQLDFVREGLNEGFKFHNPREKDRCGCGESFRV